MSDFFVPKALHFHTSELKKKQGVFCCAIGCRGKPEKRKRGMCSKHYHRHRKMIDPVYDRFVNFRGNALKRGISFKITLQEFRDFCERTGYIIKKGMRGRNCTIDRIRNWEGYYIGNIQIKSNAANIAKYYKHDRHCTELPPEDPYFIPF